MTGSDPAEPPTTKPSEPREHRLNSPNDVVEHSDGSIWFTDPTYGIHDNYEGHEASSEIGSRNVYRLDRANGDLISVVDDFDQPNGLAFSPDETRVRSLR